MPDAEIEAIACIEAFSCGLVPVIAGSEQSATPQFALDERSLFNAGRPHKESDACALFAVLKTLDRIHGIMYSKIDECYRNYSTGRKSGDAQESIPMFSSGTNRRAKDTEQK